MYFKYDWYILKLGDMAIDLPLLILGFIFTFFIPGFLIIETFFRELPIIQKLPLQLLISVMVSTYAVYIVSLVLGFSRTSILLTILFFLVWFLILLLSKKIRLGINRNFLRDHAGALIVSLVIFILFFTALYPAIFSRYQDYFVMSAVNWQDTAMHQSIIQTISQGNFPPQAPYFSGQPLNYYYFIDLHSAILQTLYSDFFPRILVYDNPFFVLMFFLSTYALGFNFFKSKLAGITAGLLAVFSGSFLYMKFFHDIYQNLNKSTDILATIGSIIASNSYTIDYGKLLQMVPMTDYFLQNRPMMMGLPAVALMILLLVTGFEKNNKKYFILAGLLTGMLVKFQLFAFGVSVLIFFICWVIFVNKDYREEFGKVSYFFIPLIILIIFTSLFAGSNNYAVSALLANFRFGPWNETKNLLWYLVFPFANFGVLFSLFLIFIGLALSKKVILIKRITFLLILGSILYIIPHVVFFTIYDGDMLKFLYFALLPFSLISGLLLQRVWQNCRFGQFIVILLIVLSSFNGFLTLGWSFFNKYGAYSLADNEVGMWIRTNTLPNSVFMTMPTVHSAVSDIGGRLRVLAYSVWPYSHGFNRGEDNVFIRQANIESVYWDPGNKINAKKIFDLYHVDYLYLGSEEKAGYPQAEQILNQQNYLQLVYDFSGVKIYKIL